KLDLLKQTGKEGMKLRREFAIQEQERQEAGVIGIDPSTGRPYSSKEAQEWVERSKPTQTKTYREPRPYPKKKKPTKLKLKLRDAQLLFSKRKVKDGEEGSINEDDTYNTGRNNVAYHHERDGDDDVIKMVFKDGSEHGRPIAYLHIEKGVLTKTTTLKQSLDSLGISKDALDTNIGIVMGIVIEQRSRNSGKNLFDEITQLKGFIPKQKAEVDRYRKILVEGGLSKSVIDKTMKDRPMLKEMKRKIDVLEKESETDLSLPKLEELAYATKEYMDKSMEESMKGVYEIVKGQAKGEVKKAPSEVLTKAKQIIGTEISGAEAQAEIEEDSGITDDTLRCPSG
ncbi:uncharacterized protein METZ01_LOCUS169278, partial [marine metagenome]